MMEDRVFDSFLALQERSLQSSDTRNSMRKAVRNRRVKRVCCDEAYSRYLIARENGTAVSENGDILTFFEWLLAHAEEIFALIARIIALFGV